MIYTKVTMDRQSPVVSGGESVIDLPPRLLSMPS